MIRTEALKLFLFAGAIPVNALATETVTWQQCVSEAMGNNSEFRAAKKNLESARASEKGSYGAYFPQLNGSFAYARGHQELTVPSTTSDNYAFTLTATQNIFAGLQDKARTDQAAANARSSEADLSATKAKLSYDLKSAHAKLWYAQQSVDLQKEIIRRREDNFRLVSLRFQSGHENRGSVMLSQAYLDDANFHALQAAGDLEVARAQLAEVLGRDRETPFQVTDEFPLESPADHPDFRRLVQAVPQHEKSLAQIDLADAGIAIARSGFLPTLAASGSAGKSDSRWFPREGQWTVGVTLSVPLFNGGRDYYGYRSAVAAAAAAKEERSGAERDSLTKLKQAYSAYVQAREKLRVDLSYRAAALKRSEIARGKYNNGLLIFEEWDVIENDLIARETSAIGSRRDRSISEAAWQREQGRGVIP